MAKLQYLYLSEFKDDHCVPTHNHSCWELVYYCHAQGKSYFGETEETATEETDFLHKTTLSEKFLTFSDNTFVVFPPNTLHDEQTKNSARIISLGFHLEGNVEEEISKFALSTTPDLDLSVWNHIKLIEHEFFEKKYHYKTMVDCLLRKLLISLSRYKHEETTGTGIDYVIRYLNEYYMTDINIDKLAASHGFSPSHFRVLFKNKTNLSPKQYILNIRLEKIKKALKETNLPLSLVAYENGFSDYYQFSTFFKKKMGVSPKEYRNGPLS